jgi:hypothetical protein
MSKRKAKTESLTAPRQPLTAVQGKAMFKQMAKDTAVGNPIWVALISLLMPFLLKFIENIFKGYDVTPKDV